MNVNEPEIGDVVYYHSDTTYSWDDLGQSQLSKMFSGRMT